MASTKPSRLVQVVTGQGLPLGLASCVGLIPTISSFPLEPKASRAFHLDGISSHIMKILSLIVLTVVATEGLNLKDVSPRGTSDGFITFIRWNIWKIHHNKVCMPVSAEAFFHRSYWPRQLQTITPAILPKTKYFCRGLIGTFCPLRQVGHLFQFGTAD